jgi:hypothetical protein
MLNFAFHLGGKKIEIEDTCEWAAVFEIQGWEVTEEWRKPSLGAMEFVLFIKC